ncbi:DTW domain-containing protein YfiP [Nitrobacteraceae bacterium AZCC 1564]
MSPHSKPEIGTSLPTEISDCPHCGKPEPLCVCSDVAPIDNRIELLILQHPQEQDRALGTARLTALHFQNSALKIGLSWPSLSKVLGRSVDPQRWAILYLGSAKVADLPTDSEVVAIDRKGAVEEGQRAILNDIDGVILLDGTWSQAKALWWRNAWMLKCRRIILGPASPSLYGKLRKEPRRDGLSTIEAAGMVLSRLEKRPEIEAALTASFERLLTRFREVQAVMPELAPKPRPKRDYRRASKKRGKSALSKS